MRLALDNHYSPLIAAQLRESGHDVVAAVIDQHWQREEDETLLALCAAQQRALLTNDVADFSRIARAWAAQGRTHAG